MADPNPLDPRPGPNWKAIEATVERGEGFGRPLSDEEKRYAEELDRVYKNATPPHCCTWPTVPHSLLAVASHATAPLRDALNEAIVARNDAEMREYQMRRVLAWLTDPEHTERWPHSAETLRAYLDGSPGATADLMKVIGPGVAGVERGEGGE